MIYDMIMIFEGRGLSSKNEMRVPLSQIKRRKRAGTNLAIPKRILTCIDEALKELGSSVAEALDYYLESNFNLNKSRIPRRPKTFMKALTSIFGEEGAKIIEKICIKKLEQEFNLVIDEGIGLINAIQIIKRKQIT